MRVFLKYFYFPLTLFAIDFIFGLQVYSNDFFGYLGLVTIMDLDDLSTFYNGVYPPGFVWVLKCILNFSDEVILLTKILNYLSLGLVFYFISSKIFKELNFYLVFFCLVVLLVSNEIFLSNSLSPGSYGFFLVSLIVGTSHYEDRSKFSALISVSSLVIATLFRFEAFIWLICLWGSGLFFFSGHSKNLRGFLTIVLSVSVLFLINFWGTSSLVATKHFLTFEKPNWVELNPFTKFEKQSFYEFSLGYLNNLVRNVLYFSTLIISWVFLKSFRRLILTCLFYLLLINFHPSPRGVFAILPFVYIFLGLLFFSIWERQKRVAVVLSIFLIPTFLYFSLSNYYHKRTSQVLQSSFKKIGKVITRVDKSYSAESIFTNSHDFYIRDQLPDLPQVNGGWIKLIDRFYIKNPNFDLSHPNNFYDGLKSQKVKFLVIDKVLLHTSIYSQKDLLMFEELGNSEFFNLISLVDDRFMIYSVK
ncbi:hypothetical protein ACFPIK_11730 [Algoriphagus aquatilis]|uniref:Glycosyltransferase RgtA/B/C/D-like domain-containing protein n=1 Tax=Algoriphagus aquatilis TaxID=490186 RepID=A0ABW0BWV8_9BACT